MSKVSLSEDSTDNRVRTPQEYDQLIADGCRVGNAHPCQSCFGHGCERCHGVGLIVTIFEGSKMYSAAPSFHHGMVGASCHVDYCDGKLHFNLRGAGGSAKIEFTYSQLFSLGKFIMDCVCEPRYRDVEYGVAAEFRGPPAMALAALTKAGVTVSTIPSKNQAGALEVLRAAGFDEEARLLASAFEHEVFRGDAEEEAEARRQVGDVEPNTIIKRSGGSAVCGNQVLRVDRDKSILSQF
jgi:hypothetical protein